MLLDSGGLENYNLGSPTGKLVHDIKRPPFGVKAKKDDVLSGGIDSTSQFPRAEFDLCEKRSTRQERQKGNPHAVPPLFFESFVYSAFSRPNRNVTTPHSWMLSVLSSPPPAAAGGRLTGSASPAAGPDTEQPSRSSGSPET